MALSLGQKAGWGLADMGIVIFVIVKQVLVLTFLTEYLGVPILVAGAATTVILLLDIVTDPLVGYFSDKTSSRWGRRAPWMFIGSIVLAMSVIGIFSVPGDLSVYGTLAWVILFFAIATIGFTMASIPYGATAGEMTHDPAERSKMTAWRMGFASVGILIGGGLFPMLAAETREGHFFAACVMAPLIIVSVWLSLFLTRVAPRVAESSNASPVRMIRLVWSNKAFIVLVVLYGVMTMAVALISAGLPFAALYLIIDDGQTLLSGAASGLGVLSLMFAAFVLGSIISQAGWVFASHIFGKVGALMVGLTLYIVLLWFLYTQLPSVNVTAIAGIFVLAGMTNGAYQQIPWAIYPDLMDVTRRQSGEAIEGAFSAIWLFGQKTANALAPLILALILGAYGWKETKEGRVEQLPEAVTALHVSVTLIPAAILALSIFCLFFFYRPLQRAVLGRG